MAVTGDALGFVFADYLTSLKDFRTIVDEVLKESLVCNKELSTKSTEQQQLEYCFIDRHGWPIINAQEEKLNVFDLVVNQSVYIKLSSLRCSKSSGRFLMLADACI